MGLKLLSLALVLKSITNKLNNANNDNTFASNLLEKEYERNMIYERINKFGVQSYQL